MTKYKVTRNLTVNGKEYVEGDTVSLTEEEAASRVESGSLELVEKKVSPTPGKEDVDTEEADKHPTPEALETIKTDAADAKEAGDASEKVTNEERNFNTGINIVGVNSPDPSVGDIVPVDIVMPGEVVDPKSGKVLEGSGSDLSTPQPLPPTVKESKEQVRENTKAALEAANDNPAPKTEEELAAEKKAKEDEDEDA